MRGFSAGIFVGTMFISICLQTLCLLGAVKITMKEFIGFKKAFSVSLLMFIVSLVFGWVSASILISSGLIFALVEPVSSVFTEIKQLLIYTLLYLPGFLVSWIVISIFIIKEEVGKTDIFKGLQITLITYAFSFITSYLGNLIYSLL